MINQEQCREVASFIGSMSPASDEDWNRLATLLECAYKDIYELHRTSPIQWEITPMMQYQFEKNARQLREALCIDFVQSFYSTYQYMDGLLPYLDEEDTAAYSIVLHGIRCAVLFLEHQLYLNNKAGYLNMKKWMVI